MRYIKLLIYERLRKWEPKISYFNLYMHKMIIIFKLPKYVCVCLFSSFNSLFNLFRYFLSLPASIILLISLALLILVFYIKSWNYINCFLSFNTLLLVTVENTFKGTTLCMGALLRSSYGAFLQTIVWYTMFLKSQKVSCSYL